KFLGALDGTYIKIKVLVVNKPRYRTRKDDITTNMLGVCTLDMHFVYVFPSWECSVVDGGVLRDIIGIKRKWVPKKDAALVACMVDLHNIGTFNVDTRFKASYLNELKIKLEKVLPHAMLKAKPNLESRIRTLKRDWAIVYDMLSGKDNGGFGWDDYR
ncbi:hypothetical protein Goshw_020728, partial [Gossypium schwendimanii]|nr:hypothetical protein [Gossypium schwendimanii]